MANVKSVAERFGYSELLGLSVGAIIHCGRVFFICLFIIAIIPEGFFSGMYDGEVSAALM